MGRRQEVELAPKVNQDTLDLQDSKETEDFRVCLDRPAPLAVPFRRCPAPLGLLVSLETEDRRESLVFLAFPSPDPQDAQEPPELQDSPVCPALQASPLDRTASRESQDALEHRGRGASPETQDRRVTRATLASTASEVAPVYLDCPDPLALQDSQVAPVDLDSRETEVTLAPQELLEHLAPADPRALQDIPERRATLARR